MVPTARRLDRSSVDWVVEQVRGTEVAVMGHFDPLLLSTLGRCQVELRLHAVSASSAEQELARLPEPLRQSIRISPMELTQSAHGASTLADTIVVQGWPEGCEPRIVLAYIGRIARTTTSRLIVIVTEFAAEHQRERGFDLGLFLGALRQSVAPDHLSIATDELRFVGRVAKPATHEWERFESEIWPGTVGEMVRAIQTRHRYELGGLQGRLRSLQAVTKSISFRVGATLAAVGRSPNTFRRLPAQLWQIYRSAVPRHSRPKLASRRVAFPPLQIPMPKATDLPVVAAIFDTFSECCFRYEAALVLLTPDDWREEMDRSKPAFLLVESAWIGNNGAWHRLIADNWKLAHNPLRDLLDYCRGHNIPSVFWNKEDPPHFDTFIDAAKGFDVVLTTDADCVPKYKAICGHDCVHAMPFAAQPKLHNPRREAEWPRHRVAFAGSWVSRRERTESLRYLLDPALAFGLHIFDRNLSRKDLGTRASALRFPDSYHSAIKGSLDYPQMLTAYRCYDVLLNTNSVADSPTMFSRRVFESLACGTPVVSTESIGMRELLGDHVRVARTADEASSHLRALFDDEEARAREGHLAYRHVHEHHTYRHRMDDIRRWAGLPARSETTPRVSVLTVTSRETGAIRAIEEFAKQSYPEKELLMILRGTPVHLDGIPQLTRRLAHVRVLNVEGAATLADCMNRGVEAASGDYIASMDDNCIYGERYIADMMLSANFADAEILGKGTYFLYSKDSDTLTLKSVRPEHQPTDFVIGSTLVARRDLLKRFPFGDQSEEPKSAFVSQTSRAGCRIYSVDRFNHVALAPATQGIRNNRERTDDCSWHFAPGLDLPRVMI